MVLRVGPLIACVWLFKIIDLPCYESSDEMVQTVCQGHGTGYHMT